MLQQSKIDMVVKVRSWIFMMSRDGQVAREIKSPTLTRLQRTRRHAVPCEPRLPSSKSSQVSQPCSSTCPSHTETEVANLATFHIQKLLNQSSSLRSSNTHLEAPHVTCRRIVTKPQPPRRVDIPPITYIPTLVITITANRPSRKIHTSRHYILITTQNHLPTARHVNFVKQWLQTQMVKTKTTSM